jgi:hypothetical protein
MGVTVGVLGGFVGAPEQAQGLAQSNDDSENFIYNDAERNCDTA